MHPYCATEGKGRETLFIDVTLLHLPCQLIPPLLVHLLVRRPTKDDEGADDQRAAHNRGARKRRVKGWGQELIDNGDDEDGEESGYGGEHRRGEGNEDQEGAGED